MSVESQPGVRSGVEDGIEWKLLLAPLGNSMNGYVRLPAGHPWAALGDYFEMPADVHGGLTFGPEPARDFRPYMPVERGPHATDWIGFDTAHYGDTWDDDELRTVGGSARAELQFGGDRHWSVHDLEVEARSLARQVAAALHPTTADDQEVPC